MKFYVYSKVVSSGVDFPVVATKLFTSLEEARANLAKEKEKIKAKKFQGKAYYTGFEHENELDCFEAYDGPEADIAFLKIETKNI